MRPAWIAALLLAGCATTASEAAVTEPTRVVLTEGQPVEVGKGVTLTLRSVMYAHLSGSRNDSRMQLTASRAGQAQEVSLDRLEPGPPVYAPVLGLRLAIDYVDAYHQPSTGAVLVLPE